LHSLLLMEKNIGLKIHLNELLSLNLRPVGCEILPGKRVALKVPRDNASAYVTGNLRCTLDFEDDPSREGMVREVKESGNYLLIDCEI